MRGKIVNLLLGLANIAFGVLLYIFTSRVPQNSLELTLQAQIVVGNIKVAIYYLMAVVVCVNMIQYYNHRKDTFFNDPNVKTGIMRLYDMKNGRCIRTLQPGVSMEFAVDENPGGHCFGSAVMAQDGSEYCYPDEGFTCLKYRHPD